MRLVIQRKTNVLNIYYKSKYKTGWQDKIDLCED